MEVESCNEAVSKTEAVFQTGTNITHCVSRGRSLSNWTHSIPAMRSLHITLKPPDFRFFDIHAEWSQYSDCCRGEDMCLGAVAVVVVVAVA